jgi:hypothetical protein
MGGLGVYPTQRAEALTDFPTPIDVSPAPGHTWASRDAAVAQRGNYARL